jgi:hypothetical protein
VPLIKWQYDDAYGRFKKGDPIIIPEYLLKAQKNLKGTELLAWPRIVEMAALMEMGLAKTANDAAVRVCMGRPPINPCTSEQAAIDCCRKLYKRLQRDREKGPA